MNMESKPVTSWNWKYPDLNKKSDESNPLPSNPDVSPIIKPKENDGNLSSQLRSPKDNDNQNTKISFSESTHTGYFKAPHFNDNIQKDVPPTTTATAPSPPQRLSQSNAPPKKGLTQRKSILKKDFQANTKTPNMTIFKMRPSDKATVSEVNSFPVFHSQRQGVHRMRQKHKRGWNIQPIRPKDIPLSKFAIPPDNMDAGAIRDDEFVIDSRGKYLNVPIKFYRTSVKNKVCPNEDLNEIFTEKFCLNNWNEYFGRTVVITCYLNILLSLVILTVALGLFFTPSKAQLVARLDTPRKMKAPYTLLFCGFFNLILSFVVYIAVLQNYRRLFPYILHGMIITSILFLAVACWSDKEWGTPSPHDYLSFFVATAMHDMDPDFLKNVWPSMKPQTFLEIQKLYSCCGLKSPENWFQLNQYRPAGSPKMDASCCKNRTANGIATQCPQLISDWLQDPRNTSKYDIMKGWLTQDNCEDIMERETGYYSWDLRLYPVIFFILHTGVVFTLNYLLDSYIREVNTWDGEVRMKLFRDSHKNYLKYLVHVVQFQLGECFHCGWCTSKVLPGRKPPEFWKAPPTHFEVWHTAAGEIVNVIEVSPDKEQHLQMKNEEDFSGYVDLNEISEAESSGNYVRGRVPLQ